MQNQFSVVYTRNGKPEFFARGLSLNAAQTLKTAMGSSLTLAITGDNGFQGGGKLTQAISDVRVVRDARTGSNSATVLSITDTLTVTVSGQKLFALSHSPVVGGAMTVTVDGSASRPDVVWGLVNNGNGTAMLEITTPEILGTGATITALFSYFGANGENGAITVASETTNEAPNSSRTTFTVDHVYIPGSLSVTTSATGSHTVHVVEGGGVTFEVLINDIAPVTGTVLTAAYKYSLNDDTAIPSTETHTPYYSGFTWVGTAQTPPFVS